MPSLMELVERVNKGDLVDAESLEVYQESSNSAERFLAHHAHAMLDLRRAQQHMMQSLEAIDYSDQKVLNQFVSVSGFLGLADLRCGPIAKFGSCAISRREYALGIEAIQNAVAYDLAHGGAFSADRENCMFVAQQYDRAAQCVGWTSPAESIEWNNKQTKIALIVSSLADDEPASRTAVALAKHYDSKRFKLAVYSTECNVRRDKPAFAQTSYALPSTKRGAATIESFNKYKIPGWLAPTDSDVIVAARELANQLIKDRVDVAIFDASLADPIACIVAQWEVARVKVNLCRRTPMYMSGFHCVSYTEQDRFDHDADFWQRRGTDCKFILEGVDLDETPAGAAPSRATYGIPDNAVVLASCGTNLDRTVSEEFCDAMISVLRAHPQAIYLLIGEGELSAQKRRFEAAGVGKRVGYAGKRKDLPAFLRIADIYVAEFPTSGASGVLQAMSVERPVIAMRCGDASDESLAAAFAGAEATVSGRDASAFVERVSKLIRETSTRAKLGKNMRARVEQHFAYSQTARHIEQLCEQLIQRVGASTPQLGTRSGDAADDDLDEPLAQVA